MNTYKCCMCKKEFSGIPAWDNAAGLYCPECRAEVRRRMAEGNRNRARNLKEECIWCGEPLSAVRVRVHGQDRESVNTCTECETHRAWLLKCIRAGDRPAKYVARVEEREAGKRKEREIRYAATQKTKPSESAVPENDARLKRVEKMLNNLMRKLGE